MKPEAQGSLPFPLAYVWQDLEDFAHGDGHSAHDAVVGLYHLLDALEVCAKFLAALVLAEAEEAKGEFSLSERTWLGERPALGTWLAVLDYVDRELLKGPGPTVVSGLHDAVVALAHVVGAPIIPPNVPAKDLRSLRNWVAHGGVPAVGVAHEILAAGRAALETFMEVAAGVFDGLTLVHVDADGIPTEVRFEAGPSVESSALTDAEPGLYVGAGARWLQIWPLVRHAPAGKGTDPGHQLVTQVFVRLQAGVAEYATLDERSVAGWGRPEATAYRRRFTDAARIQTNFWAEIREAADALIGRDGELAHLHAALAEARRKGPRRLWLSGPMGQGKSALAAKAAIEATDRGEVVVAHFFRSADPRCSLRAFVALALDALGAQSATGDVRKDSVTLRTLMAEKNPLVICDGLDELERATSSQEVEGLVTLSRTGGTWLFGGRPNLDAFAASSGLSPVLVDGLGPMSAMDLRAVVVRQAPPAVRDAIVRHDSSSEAGDLDNPYVSALAERADGLPLYVVLMMEWLASFRSVAEIKGHIVAALEDPEHVLPSGLDALYAQLVEGWGLGTLATIKTFLLCVLGAATEPLDAESIAAVCFGEFLRAPTTEEERARDVGLCTEVLSLFAPVLRLVNDADGRLGWRIFHDSFRGYLADPANEAISAVFASAGQALARLGADPEGSSHEPLRRHLFRHGIAYLRDTHDEAQADALLGDFGYLYQRLGCLGADGIEDLHDDLEHSTDPAIAIWTSFVRACAHFLRREVTGWGPHQSLHQLAYDSAVPAVANAAREWTKDNHLPTLYQTGGEVISFIGSTVFEGHDDDVSGAIGLRNGRILSWSKDRTLRLWDPDTGAAVTPPLSNHTDWVGGAIELSDGRILSWSWDSSLQFWDPETGAALGPPLEGHTDSVFGAIELRDGRILSWAADHTLRLWDSDSGVSLGPPLQGHTNCVGGAVQLRNGHILSWPGHRPYRFQDTLRLSLDGLGRSGKPLARLQRTGSTDTTLRLWDPDAGTAVGGALEGHTRRIGGVIELHDGRILSWADDGTLRLWDPDTGAALGSALEGSPDGACGALELRDRRILSWVRDKELQLWEFQLWDSDTGTASDPPLVDAAVEDYKVSALELLDGRVLTWSVDPEAIRVWNPDAGIESGLALGGHCDTIHGVTELRDGRILSWSEDRTLRLWDPNTGSATPLDGHSDDVSGALEISDGRILSWSEDHTLRLWDCPTGTAAAQALEGHSEYASDALWLRSGSILWWSPDRRWLRLWDPESCTAGPLLEGHPRRVSGALELRDTRILSWSEDGTLQLWNPDTGAAIGRPLKGHTNGVTGALELRNGRILSWSYDNTLRVWHGDGSIDIPPFEGHTRMVTGALELRDGRILSWSEDETLRCWDPATGTAIGRPLEGHSIDGQVGGAGVNGALELRDGRILSWSKDRTLRFWHSSNGTAMGEPLRGHTGEVRGALELRDGQILSWAWDPTPLLWEARTGAAGPSLTGHASWVHCAFELRDGRILSWSEDRTIRFWDPVSAITVETRQLSTDLKWMVSTPLGFIWYGSDSLVVLSEEDPSILHAWWSLLPLDGTIATDDAIATFRRGAPIIVNGVVLASSEIAEVTDAALGTVRQAARRREVGRGRRRGRRRRRSDD